MPSNPCLDCWTPTTNGPRCQGCQAAYDQRRNRQPLRAERTSRAWRTITAQALTNWRDTNGNWCPGWRRPAHPADELTVDHWNPGDPTVLTVLCRSCNSSKGDTIPTDDDARRVGLEK